MAGDNEEVSLKTCCVCNRERPKKELRTFYPTEAEKDLLRRSGETEVLQAYRYCASCIRLISSEETALPLLRGVMETQARHNGVPSHKAEEAAGKFETFLKSLPRKSS